MDRDKKIKAVQDFLSILLSSDSLAEIRIPESSNGPLAGIFDDFGEMAQEAVRMSGEAPGVYVTLNRLKKEFEERVTNKVVRAKDGVKDSQIEQRLWLPIDFDPVRKAKTPSSEAEHEAAIAMARRCRKWLLAKNWPEPLIGDSGNGAHLLYQIDLPNSLKNTQLIKDVLELISLKCSNAEIEVDTGNFNASRIWRVYGTFNRKGSSSDKRPHRLSELLDTPEKMQTVTLEQLRELSSTLPTNLGEETVEQDVLARWIIEQKVPVLFDAPWKGTGHKWILQCPWNETHLNKSAFIARFPDNGIAAGCLHTSCSANKWPSLRALFEKRSGIVSPQKGGYTTQASRFQKNRQSKQAELLLDLKNDSEFFCSPEGQAFATVQLNGHRETHKISSTAFDRFLRSKYFDVTKSAVSPQAVRDAILQFDAIARFESPKQEVFLRVAAKDSVNCLDLADDAWRTVRFDADGWRVLKNSSVKFRRTQGMLPLPKPTEGGDIEELRTFLNLRTNDDWILFVSNLLQSLLPRGPYPVLGLLGEAGSAKTTTSRIVRALIDPNSAPARSMPKDERDLMVAAQNSRMLVFDNLSYLPPWFSDAICRLSTGAGFATRLLYSDAEESLFDGQRPIVFNGIDQLPNRTDLIDRSLVLDLAVIRKYESEKDFWTRFEEARPRLLGALLDLAVSALRKVPSIRLKSAPRMADFAALGTACEGPLGLESGRFMKAYDRNRIDSSVIALDASPISALIIGLAKEGPWEGSATSLLRKLSKRTDEATMKKPGVAKKSTNAFKRFAPSFDCNAESRS